MLNLILAISLIDLPLAVGLPVFIILFVLLGFLIYSISFRILNPYITKKHERVGRVLFRTSASLLAFILSLTFANQRVNYFKLKDSFEMEAAKFVDIYMNLEIYGSAEATKQMANIRDYIISQTENEIDPNASDPFQSELFQKFRQLYQGIHELPAQNSLQEKLKSTMSADVEEISDYLQVRIYVAGEKSFNLAYTSGIGFIIICILFVVYPPDRISILFLALYHAFLSVVLYFNIMMANPVIGPLKIEPESYLILRNTIENSLSSI